MTENQAPIACSLPARESKDQIGEWRGLIDHQVRTERVDGGYALTFHPDLAPVVEDLARRESACCGFLDIATTATDREVRLVMTSENEDALPVIEVLVGREK